MTIKRIISTIIGYFILSLGVSLIIITYMGNAPYTVLTLAVAKAGLAFNMTLGTWIILTEIVTCLIGYIFYRFKKPLLPSLVIAFCFGIFIDFWLLTVFPGLSFAASPLLHRFLIAGGASLIIAFGVGLCIHPFLLVGPYDFIILALQDLLQTSYCRARIFIDASFLIISFILMTISKDYSPFGILTLISIPVNALLTQWMLPITKKIYDKL